MGRQPDQAGADLAHAQRHARELPVHARPIRVVIRARRSGAGHQMEAGGSVRTSSGHVTRGADVPAIDQPNAGQRYMWPLRQDGDDPFQELVHVADLGQLQ